MTTGPNPKLLSRFCGPFKIPRKVGQVGYKLQLSTSSSVHLVIHVNQLHKYLFLGETKVDDMVLVEYVEPPTQSHELEKVLDYHDLHSQYHVCQQTLIKWKDKLKEDSTWKNISIMWKRISTFVFEDKNSSTRGE